MFFFNFFFPLMPVKFFSRGSMSHGEVLTRVLNRTVHALRSIVEVPRHFSVAAWSPYQDISRGRCEIDGCSRRRGVLAHTPRSKRLFYRRRESWRTVLDSLGQLYLFCVRDEKNTRDTSFPLCSITDTCCNYRWEGNFFSCRLAALLNLFFNVLKVKLN